MHVYLAGVIYILRLSVYLWPYSSNLYACQLHAPLHQQLTYQSGSISVKTRILYHKPSQRYIIWLTRHILCFLGFFHLMINNPACPRFTGEHDRVGVYVQNLKTRQP